MARYIFWYGRNLKDTVVGKRIAIIGMICARFSRTMAWHPLGRSRQVGDKKIGTAKPGFH